MTNVATWTTRNSLHAFAITALTLALALGATGVAMGQGNSEGRGASDNGKNSHGAIASELGWRNAAHASENARLNASPNSAVGRLATFATATTDAEEARAAIAEATAVADAIWDVLIEDGYDVLTYVAGDNLVIDGLLAAYEAAALADDVAEAKAIADGAEALAAEEVANADIGVEDLSVEALAALMEMLGL